LSDTFSTQIYQKRSNGNLFLLLDAVLKVGRQMDEAGTDTERRSSNLCGLLGHLADGYRIFE
jgi:hypothetical protein